MLQISGKYDCKSKLKYLEASKQAHLRMKNVSRMIEKVKNKKLKKNNTKLRKQY